MIAVVVVRDGQLPAGGAEAVAECAGRAVLIGSGTADAATELAGVATDLRVAELAGPFQPAAWAAALAESAVAALDNDPIVVLPASPDGRDLAPRLAHQLQRPLWSGAVAVSSSRVDLARVGGTELHQVVPGATFVATLMPGVRGVSAGAHSRTPHTTEVTLTLSAAHHDAAVLDVLPPDPATIDLAEAPRIVAGGAGLGDAGRMEQLARIGIALGASVGATRVVTDRGWMPHARQIGTTGVVVDPRLYLAFGISGAVQHTSGLGTPDHVISVNTDSHCPMMQLAHLAITADANATLDELERLLSDPATAPSTAPSTTPSTTPVGTPS